MNDVPLFWEKVRPYAEEFFQFWPGGEDLIWAESVWPALEDAGFFSDFSDRADTWTRSHNSGTRDALCRVSKASWDAILPEHGLFRQNSARRCIRLHEQFR